ncbi:putative IDH1-isocitrate dehydrogenase [NAD] subunit 1, mitochondrial [Tilletiopsis washingtonensis]|uniref:Isocitrate dehydrogenase [NAD] subunit 1, mitochondrial n=1 Tax=Tilletiopsis washingtonensis TaxID=58919 RepID=A0A316Z6K9_9BASI|nr:putative IDH1-isocitrate dehydrogenase [NAD] subunit 1, mitochondrial [Tilletiopsis washingtonensis]PWN95783.1 putative IDH1-isocitrate dehydrogenase [NAD] subunit 1, mitochondrial [Tilletiopsis washingtonensis]
MSLRSLAPALRATAAARPSALALPAVARAASTLTSGTPRIPTHKGPTKYGGVYTVTLIPGDGIGAEIAGAVKEVFEVLNVPVEWEQFNVSGETHGSESLFKEAMESLRRNKVGLKGILFTPIDTAAHNSWNVAMRQQLDIYASLVICKSLPGYPTRHKDVDFAIIRENTEGEYSGLEHQSYPGVVESLKVSTRASAERISRFAFDFALKNGRKRVTCVHKANIMKLGDGLFLNTFREVAKEYESSGIAYGDMIVDNTSMQLVSRPQQFDVMVMPNLYGNIVSNIGAALVGGPGTVPGCNIGREYALYEPGCRHVAKDIMGKGTANPAAMLLSSTMMLRHLGLDSHANQIAESVYKVIQEGKVRTADMGGNSKTADFTQAVINNF